VATPLQVFISSPGDVRPERLIAQRVVDRLAREFAAHFDITAVRWERNPLRATEHFQAQIPRASAADIVVVIVWARLGTPLGPDFTGPISGGVVTGTEFEFEDAIKASTVPPGRPDVLMYQKEGVPAFEKDEELPEYVKNKALVNAFMARWFKAPDRDVYKAAWRTFRTVEQLEQLLHEHLTGLLQDRVAGAGAAPANVVWHMGSPFRGLESFDVEHGTIFFGRTRAQSDVRQMLVRQAARDHPWMLVVGPSGSGKSSLVKAGLVPDLATPGLVDRMGLCRYAIVRPGDSAGDLMASLATALLRNGALPELVPLKYDAATLATLFTAAPAQAALPVTQALASASAAAKLLPNVEARIVLVIDQLEELLTSPPDPAALTTWLSVLDALAASRTVWIVATLRADFLQELERVRSLADRFDVDGRYVLAAPTDTELGEMVRRPARTAGLTFQNHPERGAALDDVLLASARADRTALPLLEYVLDQLWQERTKHGVLTWETYESLGGLEGAIGSRAEAVFRSLPNDVQDTLARVLRALVGIAPGETSRPTAQNVPMSRFPVGSAARALVDEFVSPGARLLVAMGDGETATVRVAHEALFSHWPRAAAEIHADRNDLQVRARLAQDAARWQETTEADRDGLLLAPGLRLTEADDLVDRRGDELDEVVLRYVARSREAHEDELSQERRRRREAELSERRAAAEEHFARASRIEALAGRVTTERWRRDRKEYSELLHSRAVTLEDKALRLWGEAYDLHRALGPVRNAVSSADATDTIFSLEVLNTTDGECLLVHYGAPAAPRFIIVDGGSTATFRDGLGRRLEELHERWSVDGVLTIELVMVSHYDADRVGGIFKLLGYLAAEGAGRFRIRRLWYNNLTQIIPPDLKPGSGFKEELRNLAEALEIPINEPFDYFVMPSDLGPAQVTLPGGLRVTVVGPRRQRITDWYRYLTQQEGKKRGTLPSGLVRQLDDAVSEAASNPEMVIVRAPPSSARRGFDPVNDRSANNLSSIVAHLELAGHTMLLTGDARADDILAGLFDAWLLDADGQLPVDVMKVPHFGSHNNVSAELFECVPAKHYVIPGHRRFGAPRTDEIATLAAARGPASYTVHLSQHDPKREPELAAALAGNGTAAHAQFLGEGGRSLIVDTLVKVAY
jgi:hypothetical protein